jgi:hypothetical protein
MVRRPVLRVWAIYSPLSALKAEYTGSALWWQTRGRQLIG